MRLGIFGGSFDPVHNGHLTLARCCQEQAALDEVWFVPTAVQPLKQHGPTASNAQRLAMLELAIDSHFREPGRPRPRSWRACRIEIDRGGLSYTVDTLRAIHAERPEDELFFLMGADAVEDVPDWKEPDQIFCLATPVLVARAGEVASDAAVINLLTLLDGPPCVVDMPAVDISSTEIRRRAASGDSIDDFVPFAVAKYILENSVYQRQSRIHLGEI